MRGNTHKYTTNKRVSKLLGFILRGFFVSALLLHYINPKSEVERVLHYN